MTYKRFVKLLMAAGIQRNEAQLAAWIVRAKTGNGWRWPR